MPLYVREPEEKERELIPSGVHEAVCYLVADLGTHFSDMFGKSSRKVVIGWEVPKFRIQIERNDRTLDLPRAISKQYTASLHEKSNLRKDLQLWRGKDFEDAELKQFDLKNILGKTCSLHIIHKKGNDGKTYANVVSIIPPTRALSAENNLQWFSMYEDADIPPNLPKWIIEKIKDSQEWKGQPEFTPSEHSDEPSDIVPPEEEIPPEDDCPF